MRDISTITVIGAGSMGRKIAHASALAGFRTILEDILPASLRRAEEQIRDNLERGVVVGAVKRVEAEAAISRLEFANSLEDAAREADMVIEAVPDEFESKEEIFRLLDRICRPGTCLVANTSWLSVTDIAAITERPADIVGMRFQELAPKDLVDSTRHGISVEAGIPERIELVAAERTNEKALNAALAVAQKMAKKVVVVRESVTQAGA